MSYIALMNKIEGQRCATPSPPIPAHAHAQIDARCLRMDLLTPALHFPPALVPRDPGFYDPSKLPMLHAGRCIAAEQSKLSHLVLGMFKTSPQHPGFPVKRWLTLAELKASEDLQIADIKTKLAEYEAESKAAHLSNYKPCYKGLACSEKLVMVGRSRPSRKRKNT